MREECLIKVSFQIPPYRIQSLSLSTRCLDIDGGNVPFVTNDAKF